METVLFTIWFLIGAATINGVTNQIAQENKIKEIQKQIIVVIDTEPFDVRKFDALVIELEKARRGK